MTISSAAAEAAEAAVTSGVRSRPGQAARVADEQLCPKPSMGLPGFDGQPRVPRPSLWVLIRGALAEFIAMLLFVYTGCGAASSNLQKSPGGEWDPAATLAVSLQFGLVSCSTAARLDHS